MESVKIQIFSYKLIYATLIFEGVKTLKFPPAIIFEGISEPIHQTQ